MKLLRTLAAAAALATAPSLLAQVAVVDPWVRGTVATQKATGAFMQLRSATDVAIVGAASPVAAVVEVHEMKMDGGVMRMSAMKSLPLPAGKTVELKPGGYHVMLMDLKAPLQKDSTVALTLVFQDAKGVESTMNLNLPVATAAPAAGVGHGAHKH